MGRNAQLTLRQRTAITPPKVEPNPQAQVGGMFWPPDNHGAIIIR